MTVADLIRELQAMPNVPAGGARIAPFCSAMLPQSASGAPACARASRASIVL